MSDNFSDRPNTNLAKLEEPMEPKLAATIKHYTITQPNHSMVRKDGLKIVFHHGIHASDDENTQEYLDGEVKRRNPYLRHSSPEEINAYNMRVNPGKTIEDKIRPEIERQTKDSLRERMIAKRDAGELQLTDEQIDALLSDAAVVSSLSGESLGGIKGMESNIPQDELNRPVINTGSSVLSRLRGANVPQGGFGSSISGTDKVNNAAESNSK